MEKGLLFLTLAVGCGWLVLDEFFGNKRISNIAKNFTPTAPSITEAIKETVVGTEEQQKKKALDQEKLKNAVDKNKNIKTDKAKKAVKDAIDEFYNNTPQMEEA